MGKSFDPIGVAGGMRDAKLCNSTPDPIVSMSFQLVIPWRVALQQSPPPLHQPGTIMHERAAAGHQKPANGQQCLNYLSHPRGQAQTTDLPDSYGCAAKRFAVRIIENKVIPTGCPNRKPALGQAVETPARKLLSSWKTEPGCAAAT